MSTDREEHSVGPVSMPKAVFAVAAGWLVPGMGHVLLGRFRRGALFAILVLGSFGLGLAHDGRLALRNDNEAFLTSLQLVANVGVGPADLIARESVYGEPAYALPADPSDPAYDARQTILRQRARSTESIYGTAYLWTAGLMNLLLLLDVWDIARGRKD
jgi:uncharacterized protein DUF6677